MKCRSAHSCSASSTFAVHLLPLSDCTFQRGSTEQLKSDSHPSGAIQGNESRRKVRESRTSYPTASFKERTKGLPPSFPINLRAPPHTGSMATRVARVTYLIGLWGLLLTGDGAGL